MDLSPAPADDLVINGHCIPPGMVTDLDIPIGAMPSGRDLKVPVRVWRAHEPGPRLLITAAVHGDECNGTGSLHRLIQHEDLELLRGSLVVVPVVNVPAFETRSRYLPDRRDLNRLFPGSAGGSMTARYAHVIFNQLVRSCDACIDLHTAAQGRTNFPNVRAAMEDPACAALAHAFGWPLIIPGRGPKGSLRRCASDAGIPTIILEGGEPHKCERSIIEVTLFGIRNVLTSYGMIAGDRYAMLAAVPTEESQWLRADSGGVHRYHVTPGQVVAAGDAIATGSDLLGRARTVLRAPADGVILGMTTMPALVAGDPLVHLGLTNIPAAQVRSQLARSAAKGLYQQLCRDMAYAIDVEPADSGV